MKNINIAKKIKQSTVIAKKFFEKILISISIREFCNVSILRKYCINKKFGISNPYRTTQTRLTWDPFGPALLDFVLHGLTSYLRCVACTRIVY